MDWLDLLAVQGTLKSLLQHHTNQIGISGGGGWALVFLEVSKAETLLYNKGPSSQSYGFSSSHVWMWELDYKESWALKNWCFWIVVLVKTLESSSGLQGDQTSQL